MSSIPFTVHPGRHVADIEMFTLSTCPYCRATKEFFDANGIEYKDIDIDTQTLPVAREVEEQVLKFNPQDSYPTIVINDGEQVIIGFQKAKLEKLIAGEDTSAHPDADESYTKRS